jgi:hypothetical protein
MNSKQVVSPEKPRPQESPPLFPMDVDKIFPPTQESTDTPRRSDIPVLQPLTISELLESTPNLEWLVDQLISEFSVSILVSDSGVGKTFLSWDLAISLALGGPWLGIYNMKQGRVLIIDEENPQNVVNERWSKLLRGRNIKSEDLESNVKMLSLKGINLSHANYIQAFDQLLDSYKPNLVIIDTLVRVHSGNENDAADMAKFFKPFKEWTTKYSCSFLFSHHKGKQGNFFGGSSNRFRGSTEIQAFCDTHLDLKKIDDAGRIRVTQAKSRCSTPVEPFDVRIYDENGGTKIDRVEITEIPPRDLADEAKLFLEDLLSDGKWHSRTDYLDRASKQGLKRDNLDAVRKKMVKDGHFKKRPAGKGLEVSLTVASDDSPY